MKYLRILKYVDEVARSGSIRKAAAVLNVTSSAVNRRIMDLEEELETQLFERRPRGVRLTAAGELFVHFLRQQEGDVERMKSQLEDLKGLRSGRVRIACSQAVALDFLPSQIAQFRTRYPLVSFEVQVIDHVRAMAALLAYEADLVLVFRPSYLAQFHPLMILDQSVVAIMADTHPLAGRHPLRLRDCARYPVALPTLATGSRALLEEVRARAGLEFNIAAESDSFEMLRGVVIHGQAISFQIRIGAPTPDNRLGLVSREIDERDLPKSSLVLGQLRGRNLPVAAAVFAEQVSRALDVMRTDNAVPAAPAVRTSRPSHG